MFKDLQSDFLLRRIHSLSGLLPIGLFLIFHLMANATFLVSAENYNIVIQFLRSLPFVEAIEWLVLFIPIGFHALYGIVIYTTAKPNHIQYPGLENFRYILQRATGMIALVYVIYHIIQFKTVHELDADYVAKTIAGTQSIPGLPALPFINPFSVYWFYIIGITASTFHLGNGIFGFCITWGITIGPKAQKVASLVGFGLFVVLTYIGIETVNHLRDAGLAMML